jgi:hypothetical protein
MSSSKPSKEVHVVDVPDVPFLEAKFIYNFHVPEEGTDATAGISNNLLSKPGEYFDSKVIDYLASARVPRLVVFNWNPVSYRDRIYGQSPYFQDIPVPQNYIRDNLSKVLSEEHFASEQFTSINISDQSIDQKMFHYISSSANLLNKQSQDAHSAHGLALKTDSITNNQVDYQFLSKYLVQPAEDGAFFFEKETQRIRNDVVNKLKDFHIQVQFNNSIVHNLVKRATVFPESTFNSVYLPLYEISRKLQGQAQARGLRDLREDDYRTVAPEHVGLQKVKSTDAALSTRARIVGYIIDRTEIQANGNIIKLEPIIIENPTANRTVDLKIKYYSNYHYTIRSVAEFIIPSIVEDTGELVVAKFLISSRPTAPVVVNCQEFTPPPTPADTRFTWRYEDEKLFISWAFPPNPQRDIKQFQVFRRSSILEPFQLMKQISFDNSSVQAPYFETPDARLIEATNDPKLFWIDDEFNKDSNFIYALASIDAHGMVSAYGPQTRVTFNRYKNRLIAERISPSGAPRPYPNAFLTADVFKDSVVESGKYSMTIAFQPEHLRLVDKNMNDLGFIKTDIDGASYKILIMNTDLAVAESVNVVIKEQRIAKNVLANANSISIPDYGDKVAKKSI